jgi:hypothetical protein
MYIHLGENMVSNHYIVTRKNIYDGYGGRSTKDTSLESHRICAELYFYKEIFFNFFGGRKWYLCIVCGKYLIRHKGLST